MANWPLPTEAVGLLLGLSVCVQITSNKARQGWLYTIDPETHNVALVTKGEQGNYVSYELSLSK